MIVAVRDHAGLSIAASLLRVPGLSRILYGNRRATRYVPEELADLKDSHRRGWSW